MEDSQFCTQLTWLRSESQLKAARSKPVEDEYVKWRCEIS